LEESKHLFNKRNWIL